MKLMDSKIKPELQQALTLAKSRLMHAMSPAGFWKGELSSSALSTAVAVTALVYADSKAHQAPIKDGLNWLSRNINPDNGWGDSPGSKSNLSTTLLSWSALCLAGDISQNHNQTIRRAESWIIDRIGNFEPGTIASAVLSYYGNDRTFSAPILLMCALCGRLGEGRERWRMVPQLPLELAAFPHQLFKWLRLPVVSYAIPALIAIGMARHSHSPSEFALTRFLRNRITTRTLRILENIQPQNGGYLEAAPLTGFVVMSLVASGYRFHKVTSRGTRFLLQSQRSDGSWPIDTNLATWVTTLSVNALSSCEEDKQTIPHRQRKAILEWLLLQQFKKEHIFTHAAPGGWSWTDLPGGVPDADDTSGVLLALHNLGHVGERTRQAATEGIKWLLDLRNRDGGIPTFCRGWGKLPFDRSCPDITAHALRVWAAWRTDLDTNLQPRIDTAIRKGIRYLASIQRESGSWVPLWFGNQWLKDGKNPIYGTAQVVMALKHKGLRDLSGVEELLEKGCRWLLSMQNSDNGWGRGPDNHSTIEETALALNALVGKGDLEAISRGAMWLANRINKGNMEPSPIGLYFANLWYYEKMYPIVFSISALKELLSVYFEESKANKAERFEHNQGLKANSQRLEGEVFNNFRYN